MENAIDLSKTAPDQIADLLKALSKTGIKYAISLDVVPDRENGKPKKIDQLPIEFPDPIITEKKKTFPKDITGSKKDLLNDIAARMQPGEFYPAANIAKAMYKDYGIRGNEKKRFLKSVSNYLTHYPDRFAVDKTNRIHLYSLHVVK